MHIFLVDLESVIVDLAGAGTVLVGPIAARVSVEVSAGFDVGVNAVNQSAGCEFGDGRYDLLPSVDVT